MNNCTYLIYTHSDYDDIFEITLKRIQKYFPIIKLSICTNNLLLIKEKYSMFYDIINIYEYDDNLPYATKLMSVLEQINTEYVLFNHDNNILIDNVDINFINLLLDKMSSENIDTIRLSCCGISNIDKNDEPLLKPNTGGYFLSVFPSIWRTISFLKLCKLFKGSSYRDFEHGESQVYASSLKNFYLSNSRNIEPWISCHYPNIHAISHGKWFFDAHQKEIEIIANEYLVDLNKRGIHPK